MKYNLIKLCVECGLLITEGALGLLTITAMMGLGYTMFQLSKSFY